MSVELETNNDLLREKTVEAAKRHKASWIELGQFLFSIHKDKVFKNWGFLSFEGYCVKELGMKQSTASRLLKSYSFLESEEPAVVDAGLRKDSSAAAAPNYESVNLLRLAKENKKLTTEDYAEVKKAVFDEGSEPKEVRAQVRRLLSDREIKDPAEVRRERRNSSIRRVITVLSSVKKEMQHGKMLPDYLLKQMTELTEKLQDQIED